MPDINYRLLAAATMLDARAASDDGVSPATCRDVAKLLRDALDALEAKPAKKPTLQQLFAAPPLEIADTVPSLRFVVPTPPSSKNMKRIGRDAYGRPIIFRDKEVRRATTAIQAAAFAALRRQAPRCIAERRELLPTEDVRVTMVHNVRNETLDVLVEQAGPAPSKRDGATGRKRDVVNLPELVLDAIQCPPKHLRGIAFANDRQVSDLRVWRNVGTPTTENDTW